DARGEAELSSRLPEPGCRPSRRDWGSLGGLQLHRLDGWVRRSLVIARRFDNPLRHVLPWIRLRAIGRRYDRRLGALDVGYDAWVCLGSRTRTALGVEMWE